MRLDFGVGLLLGHSVLLQRIDALFHLTLQLRKRNDAVVDLRDHFIDDDRLAFLGARERRRNDEGRQQKQQGNS